MWEESQTEGRVISAAVGGQSAHRLKTFFFPLGVSHSTLDTTDRHSPFPRTKLRTLATGELAVDPVSDFPRPPSPPPFFFLFASLPCTQDTWSRARLPARPLSRKTDRLVGKVPSRVGQASRVRCLATPAAVPRLSHVSRRDVFPLMLCCSSARLPLPLTVAAQSRHRHPWTRDSPSWTSVPAFRESLRTPMRRTLHPQWPTGTVRAGAPGVAGAIVCLYDAVVKACTWDDV